MKTLLFFSLIIGLTLGAAVTLADDFAIARRLGISLTTLQKSLEKAGGPVTFAPRAGSTQGTQEARLPNQAGIVQAAGDMENLAIIVLWMPVDQERKVVAHETRSYFDAVVGNFISKGEEAALWVDQVVRRAIDEGGSESHLESQLFDEYQVKALYVTSLSRPMVSLTISASQGSR